MGSHRSLHRICEWLNGARYTLLIKLYQYTPVRQQLLSHYSASSEVINNP